MVSICQRATRSFGPTHGSLWLWSAYQCSECKPQCGSNNCKDEATSLAVRRHIHVIGLLRSRSLNSLHAVRGNRQTLQRELISRIALCGLAHSVKHVRLATASSGELLYAVVVSTLKEFVRDCQWKSGVERKFLIRSSGRSRPVSENAENQSRSSSTL